MSSVEKADVDGTAACTLYARNRSIEEVLALINPKLQKDLTIGNSVDVDRRLDEIDIKASNWPAVLDELASAPGLTVVDEGEESGYWLR